ncbi:hypothetical protein PAXINDRAFT_80921 [Paxillus involutus ATCC 200175]|uniref:WD40 repeat-like protein n=1 Tax=Paxillus involutus ATCC 200175 TaxID=664439 RepID=A0A0C9TD45_PAXIN|nr:hypothetical protein PAXINDRAFT_80921 [Paxillus involutus ATCC 200175]
MSKTSEKSVNLTAKPLMTMSGHERAIQKIAYLPGGERIVTCSEDKTVRIWDVETGEQEGTTMEHEDWVDVLAVTRDGKRILSGGKDKRIGVWDVETHELIEEWENETGSIWCIAVSPDDQLAANGGKGEIPGVIQVYDVEKGELVLGPIKGHRDWVRCVLWSLDGSQLFSASDDRTIRCWNSDMGESIGEPWKGHTFWVYSLSLSPDGTKLVSASFDKTVRFWDAQSGDPIGQPLQHDNALHAVTFSPSGEFVASGGNDTKVSIWRSVNLTAKPLMTMPGHEQAIQKIAYLPGGERIVTCSWDKTVRIWDVENGEQEGTTREHEGWVSGLAVTRDGKRILSGGFDKQIGVWDVETHELREGWEEETGAICVRIFSVCFSPNGEKLACAVGNGYSEIGVIHVYDVGSGELVLGPIKGHEEIISDVLWSLDGSQLFSASEDHTIRCWNSDTGESIGDPWKGHTHSVYSLSLSPDGTKLASASFDKTVRFWDAQSGDPIDQPLQHGNMLNVVTFSPSGEFVASGGDDKISIWRVPWWDDSQKQVITALTYLPTPFLTVFIPAGTQILIRRPLSSNVSRSLSDDRLL